MEQLQIVPKYINRNDTPDKATWANASVKDVQGTLWSVDKSGLGMFMPNQPINIGYEPASGNKRYPQIVMANGQPIGQSQPVAGSFQQAGQAAPPMPQPQQPFRAPAPPPQRHSPAPSPHKGGMSTDCCIFVTGIIGRCLQGTGSFPDIASLRNMVFNAKLAFEIEMEGKPEPQAQQGTLQPGQPVPGPEIAGGLRQAAAQHSAHHGGPPPGHPAAYDPLDDPLPL